MPCQEWMEFQPSRSSAEKIHKVERASYLRPGTLTPISVPLSEQEQQEASSGGGPSSPAQDPGGSRRLMLQLCSLSLPR